MEEEVDNNSIVSSLASDDGFDDPPSSRCQECIDSCLKCIFFPFVLLGTVLLVILIIVFGFIPFLLLLMMLVCLYYCCTREPIPPGVLIRALLDAEDANREVLPQYTRREIEASLIRRLCLGALSPLDQQKQQQEHEEEELLGKSLNDVSSSHDGKVHIPEEHAYLVFSEPLAVAPESDDEDEEEEEVRTVPHYYQQESILPTTTAANELRNVTNVPDRINTGDEEETDSRKEADETRETEEKEQEPNEIKADTRTAETTDGKIKDSTASNNDDVSSVASVVELSDCADEGSPEGKRLCSICLIHYQSGDIVAWSQNEQCDHFFHEDCITDWLLRKPTCPSCRQTYIVKETAKEADENV